MSTLNQLAASGLMNRVYRGTVNDTVTVRDITRTGKNVLIVWAREWLSYDAPNGGAGYMVGRYYVKTIPSFEVGWWRRSGLGRLRCWLTGGLPCSSRVALAALALGRVPKAAEPLHTQMGHR